MTTTERPHGRAKYVAERCRCEVCRTASAAYERNRQRQRAYGRVAYVDAEPARQHLRALGEAGIGWRRAADLAGLSHSVVNNLLFGRPNRGPAKRVRAATAEKVLAVVAGEEAMADKAVVDVVGARRRLRALVAVGWTQQQLAEQLGMTPGNFWALMHKQPNITVARRRVVETLYDELWDAVLPDTVASRGARRYAAARGWAPPMAWDDDAIDDPAAAPEGAGAPRRMGKLPPAEDLLWLLENDTRQAVAQRFGVRPDAIEAALRRSA